MEKGARLPVWPDSQSDMYAGKLLKHWWSDYSITITLRNQHLFITNIKTKNVSIAGWSVKTRFLVSSHHEVALDLLIHAVEGCVSVHHGHLGVFVFPWPGCVLVRTDVLVAQAQRPQGRIGKFLKHKNTDCLLPQKQEEQLCTYMSLFVQTVEPCGDRTQQQKHNSTNRNNTLKTHIQGSLGSFFVSGVGGKSFIDDGVGSFTVETNTTIRKLHWKRDRQKHRGSEEGKSLF